MSAGRRPLPTALKVLRGNPGKRALNPAEPAPEAKIPPCPSHLKEEARAEWRRVSKELHQLGLLTEIDRPALAAYCQLWARWVKAEEQVERLGEVVKAPATGYPMQNPYLSIANNALKQMRGYLTEFGMTPSSRSGVTATKVTDTRDARRRRFFGNSRGASAEA